VAKPIEASDLETGGREPEGVLAVLASIVPWLERLAALGAAAALAAINLCSWIHLVLSRPLLDDFMVTVLGRQHGWIGFANYIFLEKSGRWTGHALLALVLTRVDMFRAYPWLLGLLAVIHFAATYTFLRLVVAGTVSRWKLVVWSLAFDAVLWTGRVVPSETLYWFSGAIPYEFSLSCSVFLVAGLVARSRSTSTGAVLRAGLVLLPVFVVGLHEMVGSMLAVVLAAGTWVAYRSRLPGRSLWMASGVACLVACAASVLAPGNAARGTEWPEAGSVSLAIGGALADAWRWGQRWILDPRLLSASVFLWLSPGFRALRPPWIDSGPRWKPMVALVALLSLAILFTGPRWATGTYQPPRMLAVDYWVLFHAWFLLLFLWTRGSPASPRWDAVRGLARTVALAVLAYSLVTSGNGRLGLADVTSGRLALWYDAMGQRHREMLDAGERRVRKMVVERPPAFPRLIHPNMDIREDPELNVAVARYYRLRQVVLAQPEVAAPPPAK
jgi:hypothetical protein